MGALYYRPIEAGSTPICLRFSHSLETRIPFGQDWLTKVDHSVDSGIFQALRRFVLSMCCSIDTIHVRSTVNSLAVLWTRCWLHSCVGGWAIHMIIISVQELQLKTWVGLSAKGGVYAGHYAVFHLEKYTRGAKWYLEKILGGEGTVHGCAPCRGVWGHAPPDRPFEITSGTFFRPFVVSNDMMRRPYF